MRCTICNGIGKVMGMGGMSQPCICQAEKDKQEAEEKRNLLRNSEEFKTAVEEMMVSNPGMAKEKAEELLEKALIPK